MDTDLGLHSRGFPKNYMFSKRAERLEKQNKYCRDILKQVKKYCRDNLNTVRDYSKTFSAVLNALKTKKRH